jgi:zona occludens toxin (predicted ATPase)
LVEDGKLIITNIDGFRPKHLNLQLLIDRFTIEGFFTVANFEKIMDKYKVTHIILIIDEASKFFDSKYYNKDVMFFFQYSRHNGIDIFFINPSVGTICRQIPTYCEYIVEASPRSKAFYGSFRYKFRDPRGGMFMYSQVCRKRDSVFRMYKSFRVDETNKPKNAMVRWGMTIFVMAFVLIFAWKGVIHHVSHKSQPVSKPVPASVKPVYSNISAVRKPPVALPAAPPAPVPAPVVSSSVIPSFRHYSGLEHHAPDSSFPRVIGFVEGSSHSVKYLLSSGQVVSCRRRLSMGDVYIK